jgi:gliding motility-associated lipoprotein GldD
MSKFKLKSSPSIYILMAILFFGCSEKEVSPKLRMYPFVKYPDNKKLEQLAVDCPFTFQYPNYFYYEKDTVDVDKKTPHLCWFNLQASTLNSTLYCSYLPIENKTQLGKYINDAFNVSDEHNDKATARKESIIDNGKNVKGLMFEIEGPVATTLQFYLTDSTHHFLRASLYINDKVNPDSTAPIIEFLKKDIFRTIESFEWKNK